MMSHLRDKHNHVLPFQNTFSGTFDRPSLHTMIFNFRKNSIIYLPLAEQLPLIKNFSYRFLIAFIRETMWKNFISSVILDER